ncbi:MAG: hypothetical protein ACHRXM_29385 [Isosphaerales bacterium]
MASPSQVESIFFAALEKKAGAERAAYSVRRHQAHAPAAGYD